MFIWVWLDKHEIRMFWPNVETSCIPAPRFNLYTSRTNGLSNNEYTLDILHPSPVVQIVAKLWNLFIVSFCVYLFGYLKYWDFVYNRSLCSSGGADTENQAIAIFTYFDVWEEIWSNWFLTLHSLQQSRQLRTFVPMIKQSILRIDLLLMPRCSSREQSIGAWPYN